jgi:fluoroacetyl-CoA thioesterase
VGFVPVNTGVSGSVELAVSMADTAVSLRSGDVPVLATPRIVGLCEEASITALAGRLDPTETTVGTQVELTHLAPIKVGSVVRATATLEKTEGRRLVFSVTVTDHAGLVAAGKLTRVVVNTRQFLDKAR